MLLDSGFSGNAASGSMAWLSPADGPANGGAPGRRAARDTGPGDPPSPDGATTAPEYLARLRALRLWTGAASLRDLARSSGVPRATLGDLLSPRRTRLPRLDVVTAVVKACGATERQVRAWEQCWRDLRADDNGEPATGWGVPRHLAAAPEQLPIGSADFTGRVAEVAALRQLCQGATQRVGIPLVVAVTGSRGTGKTALVLQVAHEVRDAYPDGQLYADLRGATETPARPSDILRKFVYALGLIPALAPDGEDALAAAYRSLMSGRRSLVVLDEAFSAAQVRPLLPAGSGCTVVVTSRVSMASLDGVRHLGLTSRELQHT